MTTTTRLSRRVTSQRRIKAANVRRPRLERMTRSWGPRLIESAGLALVAVLLEPPSLLVLSVMIVSLVTVTNMDHPLHRPPGVPTEGLARLAGRLALVGLVVGALLPAHLAYVVTTTLCATVLVGLLRLCARALQRARWRRGLDLVPTIVVGAGPIGQAIARNLLERPEYGLRPMGFVDRVSVDERLPAPVLGPPEELNDLLRATQARCTILAFGPSKEGDLIDVVRACDVPWTRFFVLPRFFELGLHVPAAAADVRGFPLVPLRTAPRKWHLKRAFDVVVGGLMLAFSAPILGLCALAVKASGPGPVLFRQMRVGLGGQHFEMLKFRTMHPGDDDTRWGTDDTRVTSVGRILRPTHLDELPQLINVLRGEMSLVGPRPELPCHVEEFVQLIPGYRDRHRLPVGLTGLAQVNGLWGDSSIADRARFDNRYIEHWSFGRDLSILVRTLPTLLGRRDDSTPEVDDPASSSPAPSAPRPVEPRPAIESEA
jgi:exopolysaccharide biosynthesis polyprenyl glycosylphosphotransferase